MRINTLIEIEPGRFIDVQRTSTKALATLGINPSLRLKKAYAYRRRTRKKPNTKT